MNLLEHYIKEIHSVQDVSNKFEKQQDANLKSHCMKLTLQLIATE